MEKEKSGNLRKHAVQSKRNMIGEDTQQIDTPPQGKRHRLIFSIIGVCLLLLLVGGSIYFFPPGRASNEIPDKKTTPSPSQAQLTATATALSGPQPLFEDDFSDAKTYKGWFTGSTDDYKRSIGPQGLSLTALNHKFLIESLPPSSTFDDFLMTTEFTFQQGDANDSLGIYLRGDGNLDHDYRIDIHGDNTYSVSKESWDDQSRSQQITYFIQRKQSSALHPMGQKNIVDILMQGTTLMLTINGIQVETFDDSDYSKGQIAFFVSNGVTSSQSSALFNKIVVNPVESLKNAP
ncbi:family 16 glycoside hydrolase [Ktedonospora formicarum]|uniref:3-keto-alpha-glucoside-1,2-lyase/3-keto-2-hydroxy-glucal hydratase domain-containing protein n=1 Tax=Ktedonospora formicarum TaxID=2778364 RepID=A0A8J3MQI5_9CHLR|nr:family 16 glycoside hydrolase [Ktedonospora formicarum]GHO42806.1 hypothetical protein KSX_09690 [Ktedonospora formicarum]